MSDNSQGPGWWIASDGKWYPPEQAASQAPPPSQPTPSASGPGLPPGGPGVGTPPPGYPSVTPPVPPPPKKSSGKGCIIALVVVGILIVLVIFGSILAVTFLGKKANDALTSKPCTIITSSDASSVLGGPYEAVQLKGLNSLGQVALDNRALPDADGCWIRATNGASGAQGRVAKTSGGHATFENELTKAKGTSQDQGNGVSVETLSYFSKDVDGLGDEAFCTDTSMIGSGGVVFRKGDSVYYVSISSDPTSSSSGDNCDLAVKLAKKAN